MNKKLLSVVTIFLGSMLLFGVQPMVGRTLLPFFGGTSAVWVVCLCAFQVLLLGGYFYAHRISQGGGKITVHLVLLALSAVWAFFVADLRGGLGGVVAGLPPALGVMVFLTLIVGLPYLALSANSSLVQALASQGGKDVYRLYAVSNVGSLVGLFLYPFVLEPFVSVGNQWHVFGVGLAVYAGLLKICASGSTTPIANHQDPSTDHQAPITKHQPFLWLFLPAVSCIVLNAVTAELTLNVIALPLLWCLLLALFLLSYVIGFSGIGGRFLAVWDALAFVGALTMVGTIHLEGSKEFAFQLTGGSLLVMFGGTALHARLYEARPGAALLTRYYLFGAIGGAIGGGLTGLVAPMVFTEVHEFPCAVFLVVLTLLALRNWRRWAWQLPAVVLTAAIAVTFVWRSGDKSDRMGEIIHAERGFFGTVRVTSIKARIGDAIGDLHQYVHGATLHCAQLLSPGYGLHPTLYHGPLGGGLAIQRHPKYVNGEPMRVALVGMGMGTSCAYGRTNDVYRCWEISPEALNVATNPAYFTFVSDNPAKVEVIAGDARLGLEEERRTNAPKYDVIQVDAFSGDSVPYCLSTKEAFQLYFDRLAPGGFLSVHISNWHINLLPMIKAVAMEFGVSAFAYTPNPATGAASCVWGFFVREPPKKFSVPGGIIRIDLNKVRDWQLPSDEKGSLIDLLRLGDDKIKK